MFDRIETHMLLSGHRKIRAGLQKGAVEMLALKLIETCCDVMSILNVGRSLNPCNCVHACNKVKSNLDLTVIVNLFWSLFCWIKGITLGCRNVVRVVNYSLIDNCFTWSCHSSGWAYLKTPALLDAILQLLIHFYKHKHCRDCLKWKLLLALWSNRYV